MFERAYFWVMRHGSRLLFGAAVFMLVAGVASFGWSLTRAGGLTSPSDPWTPSLIASLVYSHFAPAAYLLFGAVLTDRLRRDANSN